MASAKEQLDALIKILEAPKYPSFDISKFAQIERQVFVRKAMERMADEKLEKNDPQQEGIPVLNPADSEYKWHERFVKMATEIASWSKDRSTKVGAVVVRDRSILTSGFNGFPRDVDDDVEERHQRPAKYLYTEHAERNAVLQAAREGISLRGATIYMNYAPYPCADCTRAVIQSGIYQIIHSGIPFPGVSKDMWDGHFKASREMLREAGVRVYALK